MKSVSVYHEKSFIKSIACNQSCTYLSGCWRPGGLSLFSKCRLPKRCPNIQGLQYQEIHKLADTLDAKRFGAYGATIEREVELVLNEIS